MFDFEIQSQDKVSLIKWKFIATQTIRQTKIPAPVDIWVTTQLLPKCCVHKNSASPCFSSKT